MSTIDFDVVIIGLGPTGGTLANLLAMNNLSILVLEKGQFYKSIFIFFANILIKKFTTKSTVKYFFKINANQT